MSAFITAIVGEDGIIEPEVSGTRMDPEEYKQRAAKIRSDNLFLHALDVLGGQLDEATVRVHGKPEQPKCICGGDAHWKAESWMRSYPVYLCSDCQQSRQDQYKSFDRI